MKANSSAIQTHKGKFEQADGSTLFLDEIADLPLAAQPKILRAIEYRTFCRVGGRRDQHADVCVLAATNQNLEEAAKTGRFRHDLLYRLNHLPYEQAKEKLLAQFQQEYFREHYAKQIHQAHASLDPTCVQT